jgi:DNA-binding CsgD family transcriptional regulator
VFRRALAEDAGDAALRVEVEQGLAWCVHSTANVRDAVAHARTAVELAETLDDPFRLAGALSQLALLESLLGDGLAIETAERAMAVAPAEGMTPLRRAPEWIGGVLLQWADDLPGARQRLDALHREAAERGDEHSLPFVLFQLGRVELLMGDWELARVHAAECHETTVQSGQAGEHPYSLTIGALVDAHRGAVEPAREKIAEGFALAGRHGTQPAEFELLAARGFLALSLGEAAIADRTLSALAERVRGAGIGDPSVFRFHGDAIEAKVAAGRHDEAAVLLGELEGLGLRLDRTWARAVACRCRALVSAASGDLAGAYEALEPAAELHERLGQPFEQARTELARGSIQRRDRKKRAARESLESALSVFERLGAELWAAKARSELARVGGRAPSQGLTATEERVAELIAAGHTYQETADALFVSPKTVQWNLSKIYRKLGVRSRAELAARLAGKG